MDELNYKKVLGLFISTQSSFTGDKLSELTIINRDEIREITNRLKKENKISGSRVFKLK